MTTYTFTVLGTPVPKERPRTVLRRNGRFVTFTPSRTADYEARVRRVAWLSGVRPIEGPVSLVLRIYFPDERTRDDDNVEKAIRDALQERRKRGRVVQRAVAFTNDRQVRRVLKLVMVDRENPRVEVVLQPLEEAP